MPLADPRFKRPIALFSRCPYDGYCTWENCPYEHHGWAAPALPKAISLTSKPRCNNDDCNRCATRGFCCSSCEADFNGTLSGTSPKHDPWCPGTHKFKALGEFVEESEINEWMDTQHLAKKAKLGIKHTKQPDAVQQSAGHGGVRHSNILTAKVSPLAHNGNKHCYMVDHQFRTSEGEMVMASNLSVGSRVLDYQCKEVNVTWCAVHPKKQRLFVDLYTRSSMLTVTDSHRIVVPHSRAVEAAVLNKGDEVLITSSSRAEKLQKVTKRYAYAQVVELEFEGDPTVAVCVPTILTKGTDPSTPCDLNGSINCKEEPVDDDSVGDSAYTDEGHTRGAMMESAESWPDTDDDFW